jgi:hypothetical protein
VDGHVCKFCTLKTGVLRVFVWRLEEGDNLEDLGEDERIRLQCIFKKWDGEEWTGLIWLRIHTFGGHFLIRQ